MTVAISTICGILLFVVIAAIVKKMLCPGPGVPVPDHSSVTNNEKDLNWMPSDNRYLSFVCQYPSCKQAGEPKPNILLSCRHLFHFPCLEDWLSVRHETKCPTPGCSVSIAHALTFICLKCKKYQATTAIFNAIMMSATERTQCAKCYDE